MVGVYNNDFGCREAVSGPWPGSGPGQVRSRLARELGAYRPGSISDELSIAMVSFDRGHSSGSIPGLEM